MPQLNEQGIGMARLSNATREYIVSSESGDKFYDKLKDLTIKMHAEVNKIIVKSLPVWITDEIKDSGFMNTKSGFTISDEDLNDKIPFGHVDTHYPIKSNTYCHKITASKTLEKYILKHHGLSVEEGQFKQKLGQTLNAFTTDKQVVENIPELSSYFDLEKKTSAIIPYDQIKEVREMLK